LAEIDSKCYENTSLRALFHEESVSAGFSAPLAVFQNFVTVFHEKLRLKISYFLGISTIFIKKSLLDPKKVRSVAQNFGNSSTREYNTSANL